MSSHSVFASSQSQKRWRDHMRYNYTDNHSIRPCVLQVPDYVRETMPEAYSPQLIGLGPYHHFRAEVQHMESRKRAAVRDYLKKVDIQKFIDLVEINHDGFEPKVRSCYDRYLDLDKETLAWVVSVDGLSLLHFIDAYLAPEEEEEDGMPKIYSNIGALTADVLMLENQIPIILISEMRGFLKQTVTVDSDEDLFDKFYRFCKAESPLKLASDAKTRDKAFDKNNHMLHFMYQLIVNNKADAGGNEEGSPSNRSGGAGSIPFGIGGLAQELASQGGAILEEAIKEFNSALADAKSAGVKVSSNVDKVSEVLRHLQKTLLLSKKNGNLTSQIDIPSAWRLNAILKITFKPLPDDRGIADIRLDAKDRVLYLPVITLGANSEVILRNLVAYEAFSKLGSTHIRDYVDLMCGIVNCDKDVKLLKNSGIMKVKKIKRELLDDKSGTKRIIEEEELLEEEIVRMCNGVNKSNAKPDEKSKTIHKTVKDVNDKFNNVGLVKASRGCMRCFAGGLKFLKPLFPLFVLLFLAFQSFCNIFDCRRISAPGLALPNHYLEELDRETKLMLPRKMYPY